MDKQEIEINLRTVITSLITNGIAHLYLEKKDDVVVCWRWLDSTTITKEGNYYIQKWIGYPNCKLHEDSVIVIEKDSFVCFNNSCVAGRSSY